MTSTELIEAFLEKIAPFAARMMAILKHTTLDFPCLNTERGDILQQRLEEVRLSDNWFLLLNNWSSFVKEFLFYVVDSVCQLYMVLHVLMSFSVGAVIILGG